MFTHTLKMSALVVLFLGLTSVIQAAQPGRADYRQWLGPAKAGDAAARRQLAEAYADGRHGAPQNPILAQVWSLLASKSGDTGQRNIILPWESDYPNPNDGGTGLPRDGGGGGTTVIIPPPGSGIGGMWAGQYEAGGRVFAIQMSLQPTNGQIGGQVTLPEMGGQHFPITQGVENSDGSLDIIFLMPAMPYGQMLPVGMVLRLNGNALEGFYQDSTGGSGRMVFQRAQ